MQFKSASDFVVEELVRLPSEAGHAYTLYRLRKRGITTLQAQVQLAAVLGVARSAVAFPALKDRKAEATQYGTVRGKGPAHVEGPGFEAERVGTSARPLAPRDLLGNRFTVTLRGLLSEQVKWIPLGLARMERYGLPNYFDQQRFGSYALGQDWVGKRILLRDATGALRAHLAQPFIGDPPVVRAFKREAQQHWGEWRYLLEIAPKPSNFRSVLTFLVDHPQDERKVLNLITPRLLSLYLAAYQSLLWNRLAGRYLRAMLEENNAGPTGMLEVAGEALPVYSELPSLVLDQLMTVQVPLFHQRMVVWDSKTEALIEGVLAEEGLRREDLKARLLRKAYLARGVRSLLVVPRETRWDQAAPDDASPGGCKPTVSFVLPPGSYATLLLKLLLRPEP